MPKIMCTALAAQAAPVPVVWHVTLVAPSDSRLVADIEKLIKTRITVETLAMPSARARQRSDAGEPRDNAPLGAKRRAMAPAISPATALCGARVPCGQPRPILSLTVPTKPAPAKPSTWESGNLRPAAPCAKSRPSAKCPLCSNPQAACKTLRRWWAGACCPVFARAGKAAGGCGAGQNQPWNF